jgi:TonB family protein
MKKFLVCALAMVPLAALAQKSAPTRMPNAKVSIATLSPPRYPPLALQARIAGIVRVDVSVNPDGGVESAVAVSGHPILVQAALDSARGTQFSCQHCTGSVTHYVIAYEFRLGDAIYCTGLDANGNAVLEPNKPELSQSGDTVTLVDRPIAICDPATTFIKVRSAKCLFLWRCSKRYTL